MKFRAIYFDYHAEATHRVLESKDDDDQAATNESCLWLLPCDNHDNDDDWRDEEVTTGHDDYEKEEEELQQLTAPRESNRNDDMEEDSSSPLWDDADGDATSNNDAKEPPPPELPTMLPSGTEATVQAMGTHNHDRTDLRTTMKTPLPTLGATAAVVTDVVKKKHDTVAATCCTVEVKAEVVPPPCQEEPYEDQYNEQEEEGGDDVEMENDFADSSKPDPVMQDVTETPNDDKVKVRMDYDLTFKASNGDSGLNSAGEIPDVKPIELCSYANNEREAPMDDDNHSMLIEEVMDLNMAVPSNPSDESLLVTQPAQEKNQASSNQNETLSVLHVDLSKCSPVLSRLLSNFVNVNLQPRLGNEPGLNPFNPYSRHTTGLLRIVAPEWIQQAILSLQSSHQELKRIGTSYTTQSTDEDMSSLVDNNEDDRWLGAGLMHDEPMQQQQQQQQQHGGQEEHSTLNASPREPPKKRKASLGQDSLDNPETSKSPGRTLPQQQSTPSQKAHKSPVQKEETTANMEPSKPPSSSLSSRKRTQEAVTYFPWGSGDVDSPVAFDSGTKDCLSPKDRKLAPDDDRVHASKKQKRPRSNPTNTPTNTPTRPTSSGNHDPVGKGSSFQSFEIENDTHIDFHTSNMPHTATTAASPTSYKDNGISALQSHKLSSDSADKENACGGREDETFLRCEIGEQEICKQFRDEAELFNPEHPEQPAEDTHELWNPKQVGPLMDCQDLRDFQPTSVATHATRDCSKDQAQQEPYEIHEAMDVCAQDQIAMETETSISSKKARKLEKQRKKMERKEKKKEKKKRKREQKRKRNSIGVAGKDDVATDTSNAVGIDAHDKPHDAIVIEEIAQNSKPAAVATNSDPDESQACHVSKRPRYAAPPSMPSNGLPHEKDTASITSCNARAAFHSDCSMKTSQLSNVAGAMYPARIVEGYSERQTQPRHILGLPRAPEQGSAGEQYPAFQNPTLASESEIVGEAQPATIGGVAPTPASTAIGSNNNNNKFSKLPPIKLLCSESFLENWSEPIAELASGRWTNAIVRGANKTLSIPKPDSDFLGRKIQFFDTDVVGNCCVDIELPGRSAVIVSSIASWATDENTTKEFIMRLIEQAYTERYEELLVLLCVDTDMTEALAHKVAGLHKAMTQAPCRFLLYTSSWVSLSSTLAKYVFEKCNSVQMNAYNKIVQQMSDEMVSSRVRFLISLVPTMSTMACVQCLTSIAPGRSVGEQFQILLSSEIERKKLHAQLRSNAPHLREICPKSLIQLSHILRQQLKLESS